MNYENLHMRKMYLSKTGAGIYREAVRRLRAEGHECGIIPHKVEVEFVD